MNTAFRTALCWLLLTGVGSAAEVVLRDPLDRSQLDATWTVDVSKSNAVRPTPDGIEISAAEKTFAHIQRSLGALDLWGQHEDARRYLESLLKLQRSDGLFFINYGYPDTGSLLFALAEHYRFTADRDWLRGEIQMMSMP